MKVMFVYEALSDSQKEAIDREIKKSLEKMILKNGGFDYSEERFSSVVYELVILNNVVNKLLGDNSPPFFSLKEVVIKSRAIKIAYELENGRPSLDKIKEYVELCVFFSIAPSTEALFSSDYTDEMIYALNYHREVNGRSLKEIVEFNDLNTNFISSNIKYFEYLVQSFYDSVAQ